MSETTEVRIGTLNRQDIKALQQADDVSFHRCKGKGKIVASKNVKNAGPFEENRKHYEIAVEDSVHIHGKGWDCLRNDNAECFAMRHGSNYSDEWQTVVSCLKPGDVVSLRWVGNDNNGYLDKAQSDGRSLHHDRLYLCVKREGKRNMVFHIEDSICPNNSARMIRSRD